MQSFVAPEARPPTKPVYTLKPVYPPPKPVHPRNPSSPRSPSSPGSAYLCLREAERGGQLGPLWQRQVLGALEATVQLLQLQTRVDGPRLAHLLALAIHPQLVVQLRLVWRRKTEIVNCLKYALLILHKTNFRFVCIVNNFS